MNVKSVDVTVERILKPIREKLNDSQFRKMLNKD